MTTKENIPLEVLNIDKSYAKTKALSKLSFTLNKGSCVGLLGPNGAGKTTTCHIISGLLKADSGHIRVHGLNFKESRQKILEKIGIQLQESRFYEKYTVKETFNLFASFYPRHRNINDIIHKIQLEQQLHKRLSELSGGQKQRVYLGCALVHDPQLLILDEPMTSLDPSSQQQTREFLSNLKDQGKTILLCTHNMDEAERLCDYILILDKGKLICQGSCQDLKKKTSGEEILSFNIETQKDYSKIEKALSWIPPYSSKPKEIGFNNGTPKAQELAETARKLGIKLSHMSLRPANLEDVFFHATGRSFHDKTKPY